MRARLPGLPGSILTGMVPALPSGANDSGTKRGARAIVQSAGARKGVGTCPSGQGLRVARQTSRLQVRGRKGRRDSGGAPPQPPAVTGETRLRLFLAGGAGDHAGVDCGACPGNGLKVQLVAGNLNREEGAILIEPGGPEVRIAQVAPDPVSAIVIPSQNGPSQNRRSKNGPPRADRSPHARHAM